METDLFVRGEIAGVNSLQGVIRRSVAECLKSVTPQSAAAVWVLLKKISLVEEKHIGYLAGGRAGSLVAIPHRTYAGLVSRHYCNGIM